MEGLSPARGARGAHRHELRTLTYVTLDQANGGIVRNLSHEGIGVQVVAALRPRQQVRVRFELRYPRLLVETRGEVVWSTFSGQCGIRFLDLQPRMVRRINEWILGSLLEGIPLHSARGGNMFPHPALVEEDDGLLISPGPRKVIELPAPVEPPDRPPERIPEQSSSELAELDWLSQPLSSRSLAWTVNTLAVVAALLLSVVVFLSVTGEAPKWPLAMTGGAVICISGLYWGFFRMFGGASLGARLARLAGPDLEEEEEPRFR